MQPGVEAPLTKQEGEEGQQVWAGLAGEGGRCGLQVWVGLAGDGGCCRLQSLLCPHLCTATVQTLRLAAIVLPTMLWTLDALLRATAALSLPPF